MASQPPDYLGAMGGVQNLIDPSADITKGLLQQLAPQTAALQNAAMASQVRMQQIEMQRQQAFTSAASTYASNPTPDGLRQLFSFPEYAQSAKSMYDVSDEQQRRTNTTQLGSAMAMAAKGDYAGAAAIAEARYEADRKAGIDNPALKATIDDLNSNDPARQKQATALIGAHLAGAIGVGPAAEWMEKNGLSNKPVTVKQDEGLYSPSTGEQIVAPHPNLAVGSVKLPGGTEYPVGVNVQTGQVGPQGAGGGAAAPSPSSAPAGAPATGSRADRNNNPGNLRAVNPKTGRPVAWVTSLPGYQGADPQGYAIFAPGTATGTTAQQALLGRYFKAGRNTVSGIVERWAPRQSAGGDNTDAQVNNYTAYVARQLGVDPNKPLPASAIPQIAAAMHQFESGATGAAGSVRVPVAQTPQNAAGGAPVGNAGPSGIPSHLDPNTGLPTGGTTPLNTEGAPPGYAWNAGHTAVEPVPGAETDPNSYSSDQIDDMAKQMIVTGQMPSMGMGGAKLKNVVLARRSQLMKQFGITADQLPAIQSRYSADKAALAQNTSLASGLASSEGALRANAQQVLLTHNQLVKDGILDNGMPILNRGRLATYGEVGSAQTKAHIKAYEDAVNAYSTEYAKFMSSASGMSNAPSSDSARNQAGELNDLGLGPTALRAHINQSLTEALNKRNAVDRQTQTLQQRLGSYLTPGGAHTAPVQVKSLQQYNALPKGARYIDPNGVHRVKQ